MKTKDENSNIPSGFLVTPFSSMDFKFPVISFTKIGIFDVVCSYVRKIVG